MKIIEMLGPQPIFNLLPIRYFKPAEILFVGTPETRDTARHMQNLLKGQAEIHLTEVRRPHDPYDVHKLVSKKLRKLGWETEDVVFDISGGSKMQAFGIAKLAREGNSRAVTVELVGGRYRLLRYYPKKKVLHFESEETLPDLIDIGDYFHAHLPGFQVDGVAKNKKGRVDVGGRFEHTIYRALKPHVDEILSGVRPAGVSEQIEIDLVVRRSNRIGIMEAKTGVKKAGIDQLDTAGNPKYLGEHAVKFLVTGRYLPRAHKMLAIAQGIQVIELPGYIDGRRLPQQEESRLVDTVKRSLGGQRT